MPLVRNVCFGVSAVAEIIVTEQFFDGNVYGVVRKLFGFQIFPYFVLRFYPARQAVDCRRESDVFLAFLCDAFKFRKVDIFPFDKPVFLDRGFERATDFAVA